MNNIALLFVFITLSAQSVPPDCIIQACWAENTSDTPQCEGYPEQECHLGDSGLVYCCIPDLSASTIAAPTKTPIKEDPEVSLISTKSSRATTTFQKIVPTTESATKSASTVSLLEHKECESGWTSWNGNCYIVIESNYSLKILFHFHVSQGIRHTDATESQMKCNLMGAALADINSHDELYFLENLVKSERKEHYLHIGLKSVNNQFMYQNGNEGHIHWCSGEPRVHPGAHQLCGYLDIRKDDNPCVGADKCTSKLSRFVCKKEESVPMKPLCDDGWTPYDDHCYVVGYNKSYPEAHVMEQHCDLMGAELADIKSEEESNFIGKLIKAEGESMTLIGLKWVDGKFSYKDITKPGFTSWCSGHPNKKHNTRCVYMKVDSLNNYCMVNDVCWHYQTYICKKKLI